MWKDLVLGLLTASPWLFGAQEPRQLSDIEAQELRLLQQQPTLTPELQSRISELSPPHPADVMHQQLIDAPDPEAAAMRIFTDMLVRLQSVKVVVPTGPAETQQPAPAPAPAPVGALGPGLTLNA